MDTSARIERRRRGRRWLGGRALALGAALLAGCGALPTSESREPAPAAWSERSHGYALLHELSEKEAWVDALLIVKSMERPAMNALIERIAEAFAGWRDALEDVAKADARVKLKDGGLPEVERAVRESIEAGETEALTSAEGTKLEVQLLLSQLEALRYGEHLARALREREDQDERQQLLDQIAQRCAQLRQEAMGLLMELVGEPVG